jgi:hypothetical protein
VTRAEDSAWNEPEIAINGVRLTTAQAMTIRVALGSFALSLRSDGLGDDEHGRAMTAAYLHAVGEIHRRMGIEKGGP